MRIYKLASSYYRENVNLLDYESLIQQIIHSVVPDVTVIVRSDYYIIENDISKGDAIRIGRLLAKSDCLGKFSTQRPVLFIGTELSDANVIEGGSIDYEE